MKFFWWIVLLVGLVLLGMQFSYYPQDKQKIFLESSQKKVKYLLGEDVAALSRLLITDDISQVKLSKIENVWFHAGLEESLLQVSEKFTEQLSMLQIAKIEREFFVPQRSLSDYGISSQSIKIFLSFDDNKEQQAFLIGSITPDGFGQYLYHDHDHDHDHDDEKKIIIIPTFQVANILSIRATFEE
jgi:hypothetical protein